MDALDGPQGLTKDDEMMNDGHNAPRARTKPRFDPFRFESLGLNMDPVKHSPARFEIIMIQCGNSMLRPTEKYGKDIQ
jgi:hypothetical protein